MTDRNRELLELAAKSIGCVHQDKAKRIGVELVTHETARGPFWMVNGLHDSLWNPDQDDGDALRLAVKLRMCVDQGFSSAWANLTVQPQHEGEEAMHAEADEEYANHGGNACAATRLAIVRVAADIGKQMQERENAA